eukprot:TRINITY_DN928_c0_g1_i2.p1 TRINITY_DN928_c0_g1~~TRINITY_DN928_c0_g1_i2.p1  ORF type:complete len:210 (-),score=60.16 TRINITY_DN928_c0_g1_i2:17-646(-)
MLEKMKAIEQKNRQKEQKLSSLRHQLKAKDEQRFQTVRNNNLANSVRRAKNPTHSSTQSVGFCQTTCASTSRTNTENKVKAVQEEAQKRLEERQRVLSKRMAEFDERMKKKQEYERMTMEERKELSREWIETLTMNVDKKRRREEYKRQIMEEKLKKSQERQEENERMQRLYEKERFYAKISNEMKLSLIHICRCRRYAVCRSRWSPYH